MKILKSIKNIFNKENSKVESPLSQSAVVSDIQLSSQSKPLILTLSQDEVIDLCLRESIDSLGLVTKESEDIVRFLLVKSVIDFHGARTAVLNFRKEGTQLSKEEKKAYNINVRSFYSREAYSLLSSEGKKNPDEALVKTIERAHFSYLRASEVISKYKTINDLNIKDYHFYYATNGGECPICSALDNQNVDLSTIFFLPPQDCSCGVSRMTVMFKFNPFY